MTETEGLSPYGSPRPGEAIRRIRIHHLQAMKDRGERWPMLTAYEQSAAGVRVMARIGFPPQSEHGLGGSGVQGRGGAAGGLLAAALALEAGGAFAVVLEMVPADVAAQLTKELRIPTIGIGAGPDCDAQVMVWQDMAGLNQGPQPRFVKRYADLRAVLAEAARTYADEVAHGVYPTEAHSYE